MIKAIKTTSVETEIELVTPFYYNYTNERNSFSMIGIVTDTSIMEITIEKARNGNVQSYEIAFVKNPQPGEVYPYMWENKITEDEFDNLYLSVQNTICNAYRVSKGEE
jgi:hypothetical protein